MDKRVASEREHGGRTQLSLAHSSSGLPQPRKAQVSQRHHLLRVVTFPHPATASSRYSAAEAHAQQRFRALFLTTHNAMRHRPVVKAAFQR